MTHVPDIVIEPIVRLALAEDLGRAGDVTTLALIDPQQEVQWVLRARQAGVLAGLDAARLTLRLIDPSARLDVLLEDGAALQPGSVIARVQGRAQSLLMAERVMLNFLGPLSGIATLTAQFVAAVAGTKARITCTRKTTPGLRALQKQAVKLGGGSNHRFGLDDAILIKDNHVAAAGGIGPALRRARAHAGHLMPIEVEVDSLAQLEEALPFQPTCIMLDNFSLVDLKSAVELVAGQVTLEASGGVSLHTVSAIAATGVDYISVGALTHSAPCLDLGLDEA
ncbi:nicotinate-nucleotide pyrophosphorylase [carboxylating] [Candidatus Phycosocius bacilliformis]|uniref:Probable nicotinate-nucleotide pyrophosphorylase [carboxylating] n=1 Tax=Candidatus Phycosocius bacilliformis TaxID=1445552 RepID=A0A2P2ECP1_9PROT|nr:carboxylating nicotinate-nucleotide diphosphorylase [Candidatus Phycosocius bacilliformis]GBF58823.1 nicotinate-nucleotide pyrophosphorylase [carboxylating] [Candidatus Phycosocius bacilliformis]